jgi:ribulose-5-phosphate 4-epimerase/fuculose-1-phosphate aldolase
MAHETDDTVAILRNQLAAATRILESRDILNYSGHISTRIPGSDDILIQRRNDSRSTLMPDRIVRVSKEGVPLDN